MYNKLFSKIVDSSIWLEPTPTRIVWVMFIAVMDETGFVEIASPSNVAHKARITEEDARKALKILEEPDENSANQENEGRRIERVEGGWMVLNAPFYRNLVTREIAKEQTRKRVAAFRAKKRKEAPGNASVTVGNDDVTPSEAISRAEATAISKPPNPLKGEVGDRFKDWMKARKGMGKKPKDWDAMFREQIKWLATFPESTQIEIISQSIRNGWQGLFEPKNNGSTAAAKPQRKWKDV